MSFTIKQKWVVPMIFGSFFLLIIIIILLLTRTTETYTSNTNNVKSIDILRCESANPVDPFFISNTADRMQHKIKITFKDNKADKFSYEFIGTYDTDERASDDKTSLSIKYDLDLGKNGIKRESIPSTFSASNRESRITFYSESEKITAYMAKFFFLRQDNYKDINNLSNKEVENIYIDKGFTCKYVK